MRLHRWEKRALVKIITFLVTFICMFLLINHSATKKLIPVRKLGNFEPKDVETRNGPGERGRPHHVPDHNWRDVQDAFLEYGINMVCSSQISLSRSIPDLRSPECKYWDYSEDFGSTSVIIVFYNEGLTTLLRNINAIINRTPRELLEEIILVDDYSDKLELNVKLEMYLHKFGGMVKLVRNTGREGLIRSRITGAKLATGEALVFLDAHCEVNVNWLPPLLEPIKRDRTVMTIPIIDGIDKNTFEYTSNYRKDRPLRGIFEWGMLNKEIELPSDEMEVRPNETMPFKSPTHQGGLFAINKNYFEEIGYYDPGLLVWGGENLELSFKIWQCGGGILWVPCSRIGHIFRSLRNRLGPYVPDRKGPLVLTNFKRVVEVWLEDEYKEHFYTRQPMARLIDMGNISQQLEIKERLNCKSFQWYMNTVAYDVYTNFPPLPPNVVWGVLRNDGNMRCVDNFNEVPPSLMGTDHCNGGETNQLVRLNAEGELGIGERCIEADNQGVKQVVCKLGQVNGPWKYMENDFTMLHLKMQRCMGVHSMTGQLKMFPCDRRNTFLIWHYFEGQLKWDFKNRK